MALDAGGGEGEGTLGSEPRPLLTPRAARASLPPPRTKLPQANSGGPLPVSGLSDLCSQERSINCEMWDPVPHHPQRVATFLLSGGDSDPHPGPGHGY